MKEHKGMLSSRSPALLIRCITPNLAPATAPAKGKHKRTPTDDFSITNIFRLPSLGSTAAKVDSSLHEFQLIFLTNRDNWYHYITELQAGNKVR